MVHQLLMLSTRGCRDLILQAGGSGGACAAGHSAMQRASGWRPCWLLLGVLARGLWRRSAAFGCKLLFLFSNCCYDYICCLQEIMALFEHREAAVADSANQRRQLLEVQGMGEPLRHGARPHAPPCVRTCRSLRLAGLLLLSVAFNENAACPSGSCLCCGCHSKYVPPCPATRCCQLPCLPCSAAARGHGGKARRGAGAGGLAEPL